MSKGDFDFPHNSFRTRYLQFIANYLATFQVDVYNLSQDKFLNQSTKTQVSLLITIFIYYSVIQLMNNTQFLIKRNSLLKFSMFSYRLTDDEFSTTSNNNRVTFVPFFC